MCNTFKLIILILRLNLFEIDLKKQQNNKQSHILRSYQTSKNSYGTLIILKCIMMCGVFLKSNLKMKDVYISVLPPLTRQNESESCQDKTIKIIVRYISIISVIHIKMGLCKIIKV